MGGDLTLPLLAGGGDVAVGVRLDPGLLATLCQNELLLLGHRCELVQQC